MAFEPEGRLAEAQSILRGLNFDSERCNERSALVLLALLALEPGDPWRDTTAPLLRTVEIMDWLRSGWVPCARAGGRLPRRSAPTLGGAPRPAPRAPRRAGARGHGWLRHAVLWSGDQECRWTFVESAAGRNDLTAVLASLPFHDPRGSRSDGGGGLRERRAAEVPRHVSSSEESEGRHG